MGIDGIPPPFGVGGIGIPGAQSFGLTSLGINGGMDPALLGLGGMGTLGMAGMGGMGSLGGYMPGMGVGGMGGLGGYMPGMGMGGYMGYPGMGMGMGTGTYPPMGMQTVNPYATTRFTGSSPDQFVKRNRTNSI